MNESEKTGFPWMLVIQLVQAGLAIISYLVARTHSGTMYLARHSRDLFKAMNAAAPKGWEKE